MKTGAADVYGGAVRVVGRGVGVGDPRPARPGLTEEFDEWRQIESARAFAEPLLGDCLLDTGEEALAHADAVNAILQGIGAAPSMRAAIYLVHASDRLAKPEDVITKRFGPSQARLVAATRQLVRMQQAARGARLAVENRNQQTERVRKMLLAFSRDLRVVLLRLASQLQALRFFAMTKLPCPPSLANESLHVFAPLASRLGIWQLKWEVEDLAFRFLEPERYRQVARLLDERRLEREQRVEAFRIHLADDLRNHGVEAEVQGRPKHLFSIWKKMQGKDLDFTQVLDLRAVRVIVANVADCYAVLARVHELYPPIAGEFDDYIERPKANGYQSLHSVVRDDNGRPVEVQIRTKAMHEHAEQGVAAHWAYKDAGFKGNAASGVDAEQLSRIAEARKAVLRQLLAWERDAIADPEVAGLAAAAAEPDDRIYVFTPAAAVIELTASATPVDFAYAVHTDLGHRCRGARVDGAMVPLNTALASGQTVEVITAKEGGPSLDWLNADLGYLRSPRAKSKVRAWFNSLAQSETAAKGREAVEKLLQREGRTSVKLDELATRLGFRDADALFEVVGKDEFSLRNIEMLLRPAVALPSADDVIALRLSEPKAQSGGVLVVGIDSLMTTLAHCCRPAPPDAIGGYVTRGKGVAVHRTGCANFRHMVSLSPERRIAVAWSAPRSDKPVVYPVDLLVEAADRQGLLRDLLELFAKEKMNLTGVNTRSVLDSRGGTAWMSFTVEVTDAARLDHVLGLARKIDGVRSVRRK